jgi:hypothetical protein
LRIVSFQQGLGRGTSTGSPPGGSSRRSQIRRGFDFDRVSDRISHHQGVNQRVKEIHVHSLAMDIFGEEYSQMFSLVDGVREQALADSRMTDFAKSQVLCRESAFV